MLMKLTLGKGDRRQCHVFIGAIQKIRVKLGGREGSRNLTKNVKVGEGGRGSPI